MISTRRCIGSSLSAGVLALGLSASSASAGEAAVSDINLKLSGFGGSINAGHGGDRLGGIAGSLTLPVEQRIGLQFDGAFGGLAGDSFYDLGAHLFWRDPGTGLLGLYAGMARQYNSIHHQRVDRFGLEAERYFANLTFSGALGYETGNHTGGLYGNAKLDYYLTPNLMTSSGYTYEAGLGYYSSRAEYQLRTDYETGLSLFANSDWHSSDVFQVTGGLRLTIGEPMPLRDRHRQQDPASYLGADSIGTERSAYSVCGPTEKLACPAVVIAAP